MMQGHATGTRPFAPRQALLSHQPRLSHAPISSRRVPQAGVEKESASAQTVDYPDPEAKYRRYGEHFGGAFKLGADWLEDVPRVRVRKSAERQRDSLLELAALNDRLAGTQAHEARRKLEHLKMRRHNWEGIFHLITKTDAVATLAVIEEASRKVSCTQPISAPASLPHCWLTSLLSNREVQLSRPPGPPHVSPRRHCICLSESTLAGALPLCCLAMGIPLSQHLLSFGSGILSGFGTVDLNNGTFTLWALYMSGCMAPVRSLPHELTTEAVSAHNIVQN